jgi:hypothetical protein
MMIIKLLRESTKKAVHLKIEEIIEQEFMRMKILLLMKEMELIPITTLEFLMI